MSKKLLVSIVGLGHQATKEYLPIIKNSPFHELISVCDTNDTTLNLISEKLKVKGFHSCDELLEFEKPDLVILSVPHDSYLKIIIKFAEKGIHIIKEKPFATNLNEALQIDKIIKENNILLGITLQRRFNPIFIEFQKQISNLGKIFLIDGVYGLNISNLDEGWRAKHNISKGGALLDMGYHFIDLLIWYMGLPNSVTARMSRGNRENQIYDVEDTVNLNFEYTDKNYNEKTLGRFLISRVLPEKKEYLIIYGVKGNIKIENSKIIISDINNNIINTIEFDNITKKDIVFKEIMFFSRQIKEKKIDNSSYQEHFNHIALIDAAYESDKKNISIKPFLYNKRIKELG